MQFLRKKIIKKFIHCKTLDTSKLDVGVDQETLNTHIQTLQDDGFVECDGDICKLTHAGKQFATEVNGATGERVKLPVLCVGIVGFRKEDSEILMMDRSKEPFYGYLGFPAGKVDFDKYILEAAADELTQETGMTCDPSDLKVCGLACFKTYEGKELSYSHHMYIVRADNLTGELSKTNREGTPKWVNKDTILTASHDNKIFPDIPSQIQIAESGSFRLIEIDRYLDDGEFTDFKIMRDSHKE